MDKLIILYKDADEDTFSLNIEEIQELQKWLVQHPADVYYLKNEQFQTTYKISRVGQQPTLHP